MTNLTLPAELDFNPIREPQKRNGKVIDNAYWIINPQTDVVIGAGRGRHKPTNFATMWNTFSDGLTQSGLDLTGIEVDYQLIKNGAAFRADIILPKHDFKRIVGEETSMKIRVYDSHDQSFKRQIDAMIMRLACLNGMENISRNIGIAQRHTSLNDPVAMGEAASNFPILLEKEAKVHQHLQTVKLKRNDAMGFLERHIASSPSRIGIKVNKTELERLMGIYDSYTLGENVYRLYNVLTHLSTHVKAQRDGTNINHKQKLIEEKVRKALHSTEFNMLGQLEKVVN